MKGRQDKTGSEAGRREGGKGEVNGSTAWTERMNEVFPCTSLSSTPFCPSTPPFLFFLVLVLYLLILSLLILFFPLFSSRELGNKKNRGNTKGDTARKVNRKGRGMEQQVSSPRRYTGVEGRRR